ncbi:WecB/TagA/CpsF family glycosyltransferase [Desulfosarcina ovata]|uniref:Glycosyl transferase n=1 Tax=Desulfosarcina ovata subsp. ovata TaxID=2752305 RepID=A0A5K8A5B2_9BACT|nr:WecB/TagA/CpsF family glycosyltransferase [Desulfosarcina ovata]BBO87719.1 glycosyl transferase [Desulfosarcina ovata subsp. ovata]
MEQLDLLSIKITSATTAEIHECIDTIIAEGGPGIILSANAHAVNLARKRYWLTQLFRKADVVHVDGGSIVLAARLWGRRIPERITWADWAWSLANHLAAKKYRLFLIGGPQGLAAEAAKGLHKTAPDLRVVGTHHGYFNRQNHENDRIIDAINATQPDIIWIGMGMPIQEQWLLCNYKRLNAKLFMICGGAFKFMAGKLNRCPQWMRRCSLEWLWLLIEAPRRGMVRYLWGNPLFVVYVLRCYLGSKFGSS